MLSHMPSRPRPTHLKREREKAKQQKRQDKAAKRAEAAGRRSSAPGRPSDHDPDLEGIVPGPQPPQDWQVDKDE